MKDPREYRNDVGWCRSAVDEAEKTQSPDPARLMYDDICARLNAKDAEIKALKALVAEMRGALGEVRLHLHCQGRRPETCHGMSAIDEALRLERQRREGKSDD